jgi:DNA-binding CsgD family transcriptional regulator
MEPVGMSREMSSAGRALAVLPRIVSFRRRLGTTFAFVSSLVDYRLLGMALAFFSSDLLSRIIISYQTEAQPVAHLFIFITSFCAAGIAIIRKRYLKNKDMSLKLTSTLGTCALSLAYVLLALALVFDVPGLFLPAAALGGLGSANCYIKWFSLFSRTSLKVATVSLLFSYSLGSFLRLALSYVAPGTTLLLAAGLLLVFQALFLNAQRSFERSSVPDRQEEPESSQGLGLQMGTRRLLPFVAILILYSFILALIRTLNVDTQYSIAPNTLNLLLRMGFPLILLPFVIQEKWKMRFSTIYQLSLVLVVTAVFIIRLFAESNTLLAIALTSFIRGIIILFLFLTLVQIVQDRGYNPVAVIGVGWGAYVLAQGLGLSAYLQFGFTLDGNLALNIIYILVALSLPTLLIVGRRRTQTAPPPPDTPASLPSMEAEKKHEQFEAFGRHYRLTERELEILILVCQGRSKRHIAETFVISENTVRGHGKNLYAKCGVHTKQELIDLLERFERLPAQN